MVSMDRRLLIVQEIKKGNLDTALAINKESHLLQIKDSKKELLTAPIQCG